MKTIKRRAVLFAVLAGLGLAVSILIYSGWLPARQVKTVFLALSISVAFLSGLLSKVEHGRLKEARLILENRIIRLCPAAIKNKSGLPLENHPGSIEIFVSNFGVLLHQKIIKFNQGGARLKAVKISPDFITLDYGAGRAAQSIRLLSSGFNERELEEVVERFRFETGVIPEIVDS